MLVFLFSPCISTWWLILLLVNGCKDSAQCIHPPFMEQECNGYYFTVLWKIVTWGIISILSHILFRMRDFFHLSQFLHFFCFNSGVNSNLWMNACANLRWCLLKPDHPLSGYHWPVSHSRNEGQSSHFIQSEIKRSFFFKAAYLKIVRLMNPRLFGKIIRGTVQYSHCFEK